MRQAHGEFNNTNGNNPKYPTAAKSLSKLHTGLTLHY